MANKISDWVSEFCSTVGAGSLTVTGAIDPSQARFRDNLIAGPVFYSIIDGLSRETGEGNFNGAGEIVRTRVDATIINGVYDSTNPSPISLSGNSVVSCTFNAIAYTTMRSELDTAISDIAINAADIDSLEASVQDLDPRVTQNTADIAINAADIATNTADIATVTGDLAVLDDDVSYREMSITALEQGGSVVGNGPTSVLISAGNGEVIDSYTDPENQITEEVSWLEQTFDLLANAGMPVVVGVGQTVIGIDVTGEPRAYPNAMSPAQRRINIRLAVVEYLDQVITKVTFSPIVSNQIGNTLLDFIEFLPPDLKMNGLLLRPTNIGDLSVWRDSGEFFLIGSNYENAKDNQNIKQAAAVGDEDTGITYQLVVYNNGTTGVGAEVDVVPNDAYEPDGAGVVDSLPNATATIHYMIQSIGGEFYMSYGQQSYADYDTAVTNLFADKADHLYAAEFSGMVLLAQMVVYKNATTWDDIVAGVYPINSATSSGSSGGSASQAVNISYFDTYALGANVQAAIDSLAALKLTPDQHAAVGGAAAPSAVNVFATIDDLSTSGNIIHNDTLSIQGGAVDDYYHLTLIERDKLTGIEPLATIDQTKADIDALGIDAATLNGSSTLGIAAVIDDTTPQLGGDLDCNSKAFVQSNYIQYADLSTSTFIAVNFLLGDQREVTVTADVYLEYSNFIANKVCGYVVLCVNWGAYTITFPSGTKFAAGAAPSFTAAGTDKILIMHDADNTYTVHVVAQDIKVP